MLKWNNADRKYLGVDLWTPILWYAVIFSNVGSWPNGKALPEERMTIASVLPTGYGDAKYVCELMLDETLHLHQDRFRAMTVRLGQVAGSSTSGYWNPMEHLPFVIKSSQTLNVLPDFDGLLSWTPVDEVASTLVDLAFIPETETPYTIYHIDNPIRQAWKDMIPMLARFLGIPSTAVVSFEVWIQRVKDHRCQLGGPEGENPAISLIHFLDDNFLRMSCGGLLLETKKKHVGILVLFRLLGRWAMISRIGLSNFGEE